MNHRIFEGLALLIPADHRRCHYVKAKVRVHRYANSRLALFHGPRKLAVRYPGETALCNTHVLTSFRFVMAARGNPLRTTPLRLSPRIQQAIHVLQNWTVLKTRDSLSESESLRTVQPVALAYILESHPLPYPPLGVFAYPRSTSQARGARSA